MVIVSVGVIALKYLYDLCLIESMRAIKDHICLEMLVCGDVLLMIDTGDFHFYTEICWMGANIREHRNQTLRLRHIAAAL